MNPYTNKYIFPFKLENYEILLRTYGIHPIEYANTSNKFTIYLSEFPKYQVSIQSIKIKFYPSIFNVLKAILDL